MRENTTTPENVCRSPLSTHQYWEKLRTSRSSEQLSYTKCYKMCVRVRWVNPLPELDSVRLLLYKHHSCDAISHENLLPKQIVISLMKMWTHLPRKFNKMYLIKYLYDLTFIIQLFDLCNVQSVVICIVITGLFQIWNILYNKRSA